MTSATRAAKDRQKAVRPRGKLAARIAGFFDGRRGNISVSDDGVATMATSQYLAGLESQCKHRVAEELREATRLLGRARARADDSLGTYTLKLAGANANVDALYLCEQIHVGVVSAANEALSAAERARALALAQQRSFDTVSAVYLRAGKIDDGTPSAATATLSVSREAEGLAAEAAALRADCERTFSRHLHLNDRP